MDLSELIEKYGLEKVEKYAKLYVQAKTKFGGTTRLLLEIINTNHIKFLKTTTEYDLDQEELKDFYTCLYYFFNCITII
uniref:10 kDa protein n=1 Tax=Yam virus 1 TaxID=3123105 RepID=A0AAU6NEH0_9CLOS